MPDRDEILQRIRKEALEQQRSRPSKINDGTDWELIGSVWEGIVFAARPLDDVCERIGRRYDLGRRGSLILMLLNRGLKYPLELSVVFKVGRSLVTAELIRLRDAGLIDSVQGKDDGRRSELTLTKKGQKAAEDVRQEFMEIIQQNLRGYDRHEIELFARMLRDVRAIASDEPRPDT